MSDRLTELQRQRALAQEQLAWLDREIARESGTTTNVPEPVVPIVNPAHRPAAAVPAPSADDLLRQYQGGATNIRSEVKRGCLIYFFAAFALLALALAAFAFFWRR